jgi:hypothetical protein
VGFWGRLDQVLHNIGVFTSNPTWLYIIW